MKKQLLAALLLLLPGLGGAEIVATDVDYQNEAGETFQGYLAYDAAMEGPRPGVLIVHQWTGLGDYEKERARMLAEMGYIAFALDIYGKGIRPPAPQESGRLSGKYKGDRAIFRERLTLGLEQLRGHELSQDDALGAIGYCFGGTGVLELARTGARVEAVVSFHGGLENPNPGDDAKITASVLICHGGADPYVPWKDVTALVNSFEEHEVDYQLNVYGSDVVHSFTEEAAGDDPSKGAAYDALADRRSWEAMQMVLQETLQD